MMDILQLLVGIFSSQPLVLVFAVILVVLCFLVYKGIHRLVGIFEKHMGGLSGKFDSVVVSMDHISDDLNKLSTSFAIHVAKTEYRIETLEKRVDKIENKLP